jgi:DNA-binding NarL/FixJ family response regulator
MTVFDEGQPSGTPPGVRMDLQSVGPFNALPLSPREKQVSILYAEGWTVAQIARELNISRHTAQERLTHTRIKYRNAGRPYDAKTELRDRLVEDGLISE